MSAFIACRSRALRPAVRYLVNLLTTSLPLVAETIGWLGKIGDFYLVTNFFPIG